MFPEDRWWCWRWGGLDPGLMQKPLSAAGDDSGNSSPDSARLTHAYDQSCVSATGEMTSSRLVKGNSAKTWAPSCYCSFSLARLTPLPRCPSPRVIWLGRLPGAGATTGKAFLRRAPAPLLKHSGPQRHQAASQEESEKEVFPLDGKGCKIR